MEGASRPFAEEPRRRGHADVPLTAARQVIDAQVVGSFGEDTARTQAARAARRVQPKLGGPLAASAEADGRAGSNVSFDRVGPCLPLGTTNEIPHD